MSQESVAVSMASEELKRWKARRARLKDDLWAVNRQIEYYRRVKREMKWWLRRSGHMTRHGDTRE